MGLTVTFVNNSGYADDAIWVGFYNGPNNTSNFDVTSSFGAVSPLIYYGSGATPAQQNWYQLTQLAGSPPGPYTITVNTFSAGRIYFAINTPWTVPENGAQPAQAITDPNFCLCYDKMEITFTGQPTDSADLTSIDFWAIPLQLDTYLQGSLVQSVLELLSGVTAADVWNDLCSLSNPVQSGVANALPALVPGQFPTQYPNNVIPPSGNPFARFIGPASYPSILPPPAGVPVFPYLQFSGYLSYLQTTFGPGTTPGAVVSGLGNGTIATIAGQFAGSGAGTGSNFDPQSYNLTATIDASNDITLTGTCSVVGATTMVFQVDDLLNPSGIYGANAPFYLNGATQPTNPQNDVYGWICGDLFAGLSIGAVGSSAQVSNTAVGAMESSQWFTLSSLFGALQPSGTYYNPWAATLASLSQAYGFAYSDRLPTQVLANLNPATVDTLQITVLPCSGLSGQLPTTSPPL